MATDDLSAPLGQKAKQAQTLRCRSRIAAGRSPACSAVRRSSFAGWALMVDDPLGGEPIAVVATRLRHSRTPTDRRPSRPAATTARRRRPCPPPARRRPGRRRNRAAARHARPSPSSTAHRQAPGGRRSAGAPATSSPPPADQRLLETRATDRSRRSRPTAARPSEAYAQPGHAAGEADAPRIAIVVGGLGVSAQRHRRRDRPNCPAR